MHPERVQAAVQDPGPHDVPFADQNSPTAEKALVLFRGPRGLVS
jgi:hypothetical protein